MTCDGELREMQRIAFIKKSPTFQVYYKKNREVFWFRLPDCLDLKNVESSDYCIEYRTSDLQILRDSRTVLKLYWSKQNNPETWVDELPEITTLPTMKCQTVYGDMPKYPSFLSRQKCEAVKQEPELLWWQKERIAEREQKEAVIALRNEVRNIVGFFN